VLRAILFDFNGVLLDDEGVHYELFRRILAEQGIALSEEEYYRDYVGLDDEAAFALALRRAHGEADDLLLRRLCARKASYYQEHFRHHRYPFFPGAERLVREARDAGLDLGIVSGALRSEIEPALRQEDLASCFKVIVAAEDTHSSKPEPDGYALAMSLLNSRNPLPERLLHPHEVLAIEDTEAGLAAAAGAGLLTLGVSHTMSPSALGRADLMVEKLADLTLADLSERLLEVSRK
jgi:HAD superfamily hydrolase (TIGR01509 family)